MEPGQITRFRNEFSRHRKLFKFQSTGRFQSLGGENNLTGVKNWTSENF